jgi:hypothetical protein
MNRTISRFTCGSFSRESSAIDPNGTMFRNDVGLGAAANHADIDGGSSQQGMAPLSQLGRVLCFKQIDHTGHGVHGVAPKFRTRTVGSPASRGKFEPKITLVSGHNAEFGRFADDGKIRAQSGAGQAA